MASTIWTSSSMLEQSLYLLTGLLHLQGKRRALPPHRVQRQNLLMRQAAAQAALFHCLL